MRAKRRKKVVYEGFPFPETAMARMQDESTFGAEPYAEFWATSNPGELCELDSEPRWIATYKLVSVKRFRKVTKVEAL